MMIAFHVESLVRMNICRSKPLSNPYIDCRLYGFCRYGWLYILLRHEESTGAKKIDRDEHITLQIRFQATGNSQFISNSYWIGSL
jgi:hypothetical protein